MILRLFSIQRRLARSSFRSYRGGAPDWGRIHIMASKKISGKRSIVSFKDVQIAYLLDGISGVEKIVAGRK